MKSLSSVSSCSSYGHQLCHSVIIGISFTITLSRLGHCAHNWPQNPRSPWWVDRRLWLAVQKASYDLCERFLFSQICFFLHPGSLPWDIERTQGQSWTYLSVNSRPFVLHVCFAWKDLSAVWLFPYLLGSSVPDSRPSQAVDRAGQPTFKFPYLLSPCSFCSFGCWGAWLLDSRTVYHFSLSLSFPK